MRNVILVLGVLLVLMLVGCSITENQPITPDTIQQNQVVMNNPLPANQDTVLSEEKNETNDTLQAEPKTDETVENKNANYCSEKEPFSEKVSCYSTEAVNQFNPDICHKLEKDLAVKTCLLNFIASVRSKSTSYKNFAEVCNQLSEEDKNNCFWTIGSSGLDEYGCLLLPENRISIHYKDEWGNRERDITRKECLELFWLKANEDKIRTLNVSVCSNFGEISTQIEHECKDKIAKMNQDSGLCSTATCITYFAINTSNISLCKKIEELSKDRDDAIIWDYSPQVEECEETIAKEIGDISYCKTDSCFDGVAIKLKNPSLCKSSNCFEILFTKHYDSQGNLVGLITNYTIDDCKIIKDTLKGSRIKQVYEECILSALNRMPELDEEDCNVFEDTDLKNSCVQISWKH